MSTSKHNTDVLCPVQCWQCGHLLTAWASQLENRNVYCPKCEARLCLDSVYVPDVDGSPPARYDDDGAV